MLKISSNHLKSHHVDGVQGLVLAEDGNQGIVVDAEDEIGES